jgi:hypothetical protein
MAVDKGNAINILDAAQNTYSNRIITTYGPYGSDGVNQGRFTVNALSSGYVNMPAGSGYIDAGRPYMIQYVDLYVPSGYLSSVNSTGSLSYSSYDSASSNPHTDAAISWTLADAPTTSDAGGGIIKCHWDMPGGVAKMRWICLGISSEAFIGQFAAVAGDAAISGYGDVSGFMSISNTSGVPGVRDANYNFSAILGDASVGTSTTPVEYWVVNLGSGALYGTSVYVVHDPARGTIYGESALEVAAGSSGPWAKSVTIPSGTNAGIIPSGESRSFWMRFTPISGSPDGGLNAYLRVSAYRTNL